MANVVGYKVWRWIVSMRVLITTGCSHLATGKLSVILDHSNVLWDAPFNYFNYNRTIWHVKRWLWLFVDLLSLVTLGYSVTVGQCYTALISIYHIYLSTIIRDIYFALFYSLKRPTGWIERDRRSACVNGPRLDSRMVLSWYSLQWAEPPGDQFQALFWWSSEESGSVFLSSLSSRLG